MPISLDHHEQIATLTIDRPARRNTLDQAHWRELATRLGELEARLPRALIVTGAGDRAFCAGQDVSPENPQIARMVQAVGQGDAVGQGEGAPEPGEHGPAETLLRELRAVLDRLVALPIPVIAAINGLAYGGGAELAARCDLRVIDPAAVICFSEVRLGLMPDLGGGVALARLLGPGRAADLILTARKVRADEALTLGLVNRVSEPGAALSCAEELARAIARNGPRAVRASLRLLRAQADLPLAEALELELQSAAELITSGECVHGITALFARRAPEFPDP
jgi:enoyl-CoA hydratase/carnithine racemase